MFQLSCSECEQTLGGALATNKVCAGGYNAPRFALLYYFTLSNASRFNSSGTQGKSAATTVIGLIHQDPGQVQLFGIEIARLI
jgi:hypothetical protein